MLNKGMPNKKSRAVTRVFYGILLLVILLLVFGGCYTQLPVSESNSQRHYSPQQDCYYQTTYERLSSHSLYSGIYVKRYNRTCVGDRFFFRQNYRYHKYGYYHAPDPNPHYHKTPETDDRRTYRPRRGNVGRSSGERREERTRGENGRDRERSRDKRNGDRERSGRDTKQEREEE